ncbi:MAG: cell division topological specificity factor MinE [Deltaproteobacteria bacterium]|nr:MAG: cell division topological specificity factor MinE [Deltaproteobacteria bacterium]
MRDIFSRLGPTVERIFGKAAGSKDDAKQRLKFLLIHDQVDLTPAQLDTMKTEIMDVISKYVEIDQDAMEFSLNKEDGHIALVSSIPVRRVTAR